MEPWRELAQALKRMSDLGSSWQHIGAPIPQSSMLMCMYNTDTPEYIHLERLIQDSRIGRYDFIITSKAAKVSS